MDQESWIELIQGINKICFSVVSLFIDTSEYFGMYITRNMAEICLKP